MMLLICNIYSFYLVISFGWLHLLRLYVALEVFIISFIASTYLHWNGLLKTHVTTASFECANLIIPPKSIYAQYSSFWKMMFNGKMWLFEQAASKNMKKIPTRSFDFHLRERPKNDSFCIKVCKIFLAVFFFFSIPFYNDARK